MVGRKSFVIMVMQYYLFFAYNMIAKKVFGIQDIWNLRNTIKAIILCIITIVVILYIVKVYEKTVSQIALFEIIGKKFGI